MESGAESEEPTGFNGNFEKWFAKEEDRPKY